jgi:hypothetical protein
MDCRFENYMFLLTEGIVMTKKYLGQLLSFKFEFTNRVQIYSGYLIDYNEDWTLLKYNPVDYVIDGYILLKNKHISHFKRDSEEKFTQKILDLKGCNPNDKDSIPINDLVTILNYISKEYGIFKFQMRSDEACWLGKVKKIDGSNLKIDYLDPKGIWKTTMPTYKLGNIRTIEFNTDYINSLLLVEKNK